MPKMPKVKIKLGFRYDCETPYADAPENWKDELPERMEEAKRELKKMLDFETGADEDENASGVISDWNVEFEELKEGSK